MHFKNEVDQEHGMFVISLVEFPEINNNTYRSTFVVPVGYHL